MCEFSRKSSFSKLRTTQKNTNNHFTYLLPVGFLQKVEDTRRVLVALKKRISSKSLAICLVLSSQKAFFSTFSVFMISLSQIVGKSLAKTLCRRLQHTPQNRSRFLTCCFLHIYPSWCAKNFYFFNQQHTISLNRKAERNLMSCSRNHAEANCSVTPSGCTCFSFP